MTFRFSDFQFVFINSFEKLSIIASVDYFVWQSCWRSVEKKKDFLIL